VEGEKNWPVEMGRVVAGDAGAEGAHGGAVGRGRGAEGGGGVGRADQEWRKGSGWWDYMWMEDIREGDEEEGVG